MASYISLATIFDVSTFLLKYSMTKTKGNSSFDNAVFYQIYKPFSARQSSQDRISGRQSSPASQMDCIIGY